MKTLSTKVKFLVMAGAIALNLISPANVKADQAGDMAAFADLVRANADYERALAEARLNYARANLVEAEAAGEWQRARSLKLLVDRQQLVLRRLASDEYKLRQKISQAEGFIKRTSRILMGNVTLDSLAALRVLQARYIPPQITLDAMSATAPILSEGDVIATSRLSVVEAFPGGNVGEMIHHLSSHKLGVAPWGEGHRAIVQAMVTMSDATNQQVLAFRDALRDLSLTVNPFELPDRPTHRT